MPEHNIKNERLNRSKIQIFGAGTGAMRIGFEKTVVAAVISVALGAIASEAALAQRSRNYTPSEFREVLYGLGYNVPLVDTPLTDAQTQQAIREFQRQQGIAIDGIAGVQTQDVAADALRNLQQNLNVVINPKPPLPVNQFYGSQTTEVVRQFQQKFDLPITGQATLDVRNRLQQAAKGNPQNQSLIYTTSEFLAVLYGLGYDVNIDSPTLNDARTQQAIRDFQRHYNLIVDGVAGPQTQAVAGNIVRNLQNNLNLVVKPDPPLPLNEFYTPQMVSAVRQFQRLFDLPVTGIASLEVRQKLDRSAKRISQ